jgi:arylsulfatase A
MRLLISNNQVTREYIRWRNGLFLICFVALILYGCRQPAKPVKPNIIVIMADDLGYGGISSYGETTIRTPNIDALAKNGIRFLDFHSNGSVCTPTRAAFLTGNYQQRSGLEGVIYVRGETRQLGLDTAQVTIAELLKNNGYTTGIMGKWHLGYNKAFNPVYHGFDEFYGFLSGNIDYHSHFDNAGAYDWWHNLDSIQEEGYSTDLITEHSVDFIAQHRDEPFFLYVAHEAPHVPFQGRNDPAYRFPGKEFTYYGPAENKEAVYKEMMEVMDEGVGKIMQALEENNLAENTLVFFISDNGAEVFGNNGGLNGSKGDLLEGGHRVPAIACWKGRIVPAESHETLVSMDLLPTVLSVSEAKIPEGLAFDGLDFSSVLFQESNLKERTLYWRYQKQKAVRKDQWKLLITASDTALYDLKADIKETTDLSGTHEDVAKDLVELLRAWEKDVGKTGEGHL